MRRGWIPLLAIVVLTLTACRASTADTTVALPSAAEAATTSTAPATTSTTATPSTTTTTTTTIATDFPVVVETDAGRVTLERRPERVVSLSASHTEMLYAIGSGGQVAGTDLTSNYPEAAQATPKVDSFNFSIEEVAALDPDLVILAFDFQGEAAALETLGIPFLLLGPPPDIFAAFEQLRVVGSATGHESEAERLAAELQEAAEALIAGSPGADGVRIYHEVDETLFTATSDTFIGDIYSRLNLVNIADTVDGEFPQLTPEFIIDQNPEFIFLADAGFGVTAESVAARAGWETIDAVQAGNVIALDTDVAGRWGPRTVDLMAQVLEAVTSP